MKKNILKDFLRNELKDTNYTPGDIIKLHRNALGISLEELSEKSSISKEEIVKYENSISVPDETTIIILAKHLSLHPDSIKYPNQ